MFTDRHYLETISPNQLDDYLEKAWFRTGQHMFTCYFLCIQGDILDAVWLRLPLPDFKFRASSKRLMKRNAKKFSICIQPALFDEAREALYQIHKTRFEGYVSPSLKECLLDESTTNIHNTYEIGIYDGKELVGLSYFDVGKDSLASIMGLYHPDYQKYSLGFYTMLLEIEFGRERAMTYYYPGYLVYKYDRFDYKLQVGGAMEYYDLAHKKWKIYKDLDVTTLPSERIKKQLSELQKHLDQLDIPTKNHMYPLYDKFDYLPYNRSLCFPWFLSCPSKSHEQHFVTIYYDLFQDVYSLSTFYCEIDFKSFIYFSLSGYDPQTSCLGLLYHTKTVKESTSSLEIANVIKDMQPLRG